jgi:hypothetical protein
VRESSDGNVTLVYSRLDEIVGAGDTEFNVWREDAEALLEVIVDVIGGLACTEAVGSVARGQAERECGVVVKLCRVGVEMGGEAVSPGTPCLVSGT